MSIEALFRELGPVISKALADVAAGYVKMHTRGRSIAVFKNESNGHIGWHYAKNGTQPGDRFHYDYGAGIGRNEDGQYLWVAPVSGADIADLRANPETLNIRDFVGAIEWEDGSKRFGTVSVRDQVADAPIQYYIDGNPVSLTEIECINAIHTTPSDAIDVDSWFQLISNGNGFDSRAGCLASG